MPTIREKISTISNLAPPVTIRQALNSTTVSAVQLGNSRVMSLERSLTMQLSGRNKTLEVCT